MDLAPLGAVTDEAHGLQDSQVLGDRRLGDPGVVGQRAHGLLPLADESFEDGAACRITEGLEKLVRRGLHGRIIASGLLIVKGGE